MFATTFEELKIWQESRGLVKEIYGLSVRSEAFKRDWGFRDQITRAMVSVMNNIAEGFERESKAEFARFLAIAKGSCGEVRSMLYAASDMEYISSEDSVKLNTRLAILSKQIATFIKKLKD